MQPEPAWPGLPSLSLPGRIWNWACSSILIWSLTRRAGISVRGKTYLTQNLYNPVDLDTDQWMEAAKAMGAKYAVFVAKHCSGFLQWQTDIYPYGVRQSGWRDGKGDVVGDFVESCRKYGIKPGIYASVTANGYWEVDNPGLVNQGKGGDPEKQAEYAGVCENMLTELWSRYGELTEVWFDGGALPPDKGGPDMIPILQEFQPNAIVFQGPHGIHPMDRERKRCGKLSLLGHCPGYGLHHQ